MNATISPTRPSAGNRPRRKDKKRKKPSAIFKKFIIFAVIAAVLGIVFVTLSMIDDYNKGSLKAATQLVSINENATTKMVANELEQRGVIKSAMLFRWFSRIKGYDGKYIVGNFEIVKGSGYEAIMKQLTQTVGKQSRRVTIPEGFTSARTASSIEAAGLADAESFLAATKTNYYYSFLPKTSRDDNLEGYLFPDTYTFTNQDPPEEMVKTMLRRFDSVFDDKYKARATELGMSIDQVVILASVIEAEAGSDDDRTKISGVFHNRLESKTYPYLESCATVQYILKERKTILSAEDTQIKSPYNTYINKGLPIGPICNPGKASIEAALWPEQTDYMYFQSDANGKTYYAKTLQEHEAIRRQIQ